MNALAVLALLFVAHAYAVAPLYGLGTPNSIDGRYIVVFKPEISDDNRAAHLSNYSEFLVHEYEMGDFKGFAAYLDEGSLETLIESDDVAYIEVDQVVRTAKVAEACSNQADATWGLDRLDNRNVDLDDNYHYPATAGTGVNVYIVDTGINIAHTDFGGRAKWGNNFVDSQNTDCNGHGTHVAGTVGGTKWGVAKKTTLIAVKVLKCDGSGTNSGVIGGVNWVTSQYNSNRKPSVANMSLGGGISTALDSAVSAAVRAGVTFVVAAGNDNTAACNSSPARVADAISVGATTVEDQGTVEKDQRSSFSNYGTCVHILAPGELITSAWYTSTTATKTISGTSMAAPHVAGAAALYLAQNPTSTPAAVKNALISSSSTGKVSLVCPSSGTCNSTPNRLLYTGGLCA